MNMIARNAVKFCKVLVDLDPNRPCLVLVVGLVLPFEEKEIIKVICCKLSLKMAPSQNRK
jgi:hypothetical protein